MKTWFILLLIVSCCLTSSPASAAPVSASVPLDSWVYPALDKLSALGLIESALQGSRPYSRSETARQVREAMDRSQAHPAPTVAGELVERLRTEFNAELSEQTSSDKPGYWKPLRELQIQGIFRDGESTSYAGSGIDAAQFPLNTNNYGLRYEDGGSVQAILSTDARFLGRFLLEYRPVVLVNKEGDLDIRTLTGRAALGLGPFEISAGRQALWWGQGRHGSLVLTNNAQPLDMLRVTTPSPVQLPWIFRYLGPFSFDAFWSKLEENRDVPEPYFAGLRVNMKPLPWFELGASRTVTFGGEGRPDVAWDEFITILGGKNLAGDEDTSNNLAAIDARIRIPFLWDAEIYGELGGEDEAGQFISRKAFLVGIYLPRLEPSGRISLRVEHADLSTIDFERPVWYRHSQYTSGYTHKGQILGHHTGGDSRDTYAEFTVRFPRADLRLSLDYERRGETLPVQETHLQPGLSLEWPLGPQMRLIAHYSTDKVSNFGYVEGEDRNLHFGRAGMTFTW
ncbi:MAG: capsule assembly Wzi family protein [bacterium]|nr:capsule assembly Wzi family protein [bacterium]